MIRMRKTKQEYHYSEKDTIYLVILSFLHILQLFLPSGSSIIAFFQLLSYNQCRIYIEAKEAVLGGPRTQGTPKFIKKIKMAAE